MTTPDIEQIKPLTVDELERLRTGKPRNLLVLKLLATIHALPAPVTRDELVSFTRRFGPICQSDIPRFADAILALLKEKK